MAEQDAYRCGQPVVIPGVFTSVARDTGHRCVREPGHDGVHRWSARWEGTSPAEVEAEIRRDAEQWDRDEEEDRPRGGSPRD